MACIIRSMLPLCLLIVALLWSSGSPAQTYSSGSEECLDCHEISDDSLMTPLLDSSPHWAEGNPNNPRGEKGCESCHGPSAEHARRPTLVAPPVSYGPRWNSGVEAQTETCQNCHGEKAGAHWSGGQHQKANLTCASCHSGHASPDRAMVAEKQQDVCLVCHKQQKDGIHNLKKPADQSPACTQCHAPHANTNAKLAMLNNRSAGCVHCHNLVAMSQAPGANPKAASYHKTMTQRGRLCTDCHRSIAHVSTEGVAPVVAQATSRGVMTLFSPGIADAEWLISNHPGAQSLRQGLDCEQCHLGQERDMGASLAKRGQAVSRDVDAAFAVKEGKLHVSLTWQGPVDDKQISIMWGNEGNEPFRRGGCWAACHNDMPGMSQDRGQQQGKYLWAARAQQQRIGQPPRLKSGAELNELMSQGNFIEIWQATMSGPSEASFRGGTILDQLTWRENSELNGSVEYTKGRWTVTFTRPLPGGAGHAKSFLPDKHYTFGVALHGNQLPPQAHWVSLPKTFSLDDRETDFISAQ